MSAFGKPERYDEALRWLRANGHDLGMLTGQDTAVLLAIDATWRAYALADQPGRERTWTAIYNLFGAMQPKCWRLALETVARHLDWSDRERMRKQLLLYTAPDLHEFLA